MNAPYRLTGMASVAVPALLVALAGCADRELTPPDINSDLSSSSSVTVTATDPDTGSQGTTLDVAVIGSGFDRGSQAQWAQSGVPSPQVTTNSTRFVNSKKLIANITIAPDADQGLYDVIVTASTGNKGIGTELFEVQKTARKLLAPYDATDLGALPGNTRSRANGMNDVGQIVGSSWDRGDAFDKPTLWTVSAADGSVAVEALEMPAGASYTSAYAIANNGIAVGNSGIGPVYWDATGVHTLGGGGWARDVTVLGDDVTTIAVGYSSGQAVYWVIPGSSASEPPEAISLPPLQDGTSSSAQAVNSGATIAGSSAGHAVLWHKDADDKYQVCDLGPDGNASAISDATSGQVYVVGASNVSQEPRATVWTVALPCDVMHVRRLDFHSEFFDVNTRGEAVGADHLSHEGIFFPLESDVALYLPLLTMRGHTHRAHGINAEGSRIVGLGTGDKTATRAVLWIRQ
jgi:uncharacterized membrane protein